MIGCERVGLTSAYNRAIKRNEFLRSWRIFLVFYFFCFLWWKRARQSWEKSIRGKLVLTLAWCSKSASISLISICFTAPRRLERNHQQSVSFSQQPTKLIFRISYESPHYGKYFHCRSWNFFPRVWPKQKKRFFSQPIIFVIMEFNWTLVANWRGNNWNSVNYFFIKFSRQKSSIPLKILLLSIKLLIKAGTVQKNQTLKINSF